MVVEETVHYPLYGKSAEEEWLSNSPLGDGNLSHEPTHRALFVSMFHEMHCVRQIRRELEKPLKDRRLGHSRHCLRYLREVILCQGDLTLEPGDFTMRNFTHERVGSTHVCRDWTQVYDRMRVNSNRWLGYLNANNYSCQ
jgi:hypothetical protein